MAARRQLMMVSAALVLLSAVTVRAGERFVPVVAQVKGANGSYWNTEIWVSNLSGSVGTYALTFLPAGRDNGQILMAEAVGEPIAAGETIHLKGVVPPGRAGALRVVASDGVIVRCRVYNARSRGSVGQMVPALSREEMIGPGSEGFLVPLVRSGQFRTNVGLFNPGENPIHVHVEVRDHTGKRIGAASYGLDPGSQTQINDFLLQFKVSRADGFQAVLSADDWFTAYATIVDTRSGASTFISPTVR